jgi:hypothetical protein
MGMVLGLGGGPGGLKVGSRLFGFFADAAIVKNKSPRVSRYARALNTSTEDAGSKM